MTIDKVIAKARAKLVEQLELNRIFVEDELRRDGFDLEAIEAVIETNRPIAEAHIDKTLIELRAWLERGGEHAH